MNYHALLDAISEAGAKVTRERNQEIYQKWLETKTSYAKLAKEYGISKPRVQQIIQAELSGVHTRLRKRRLAHPRASRRHSWSR